MTLHRLCFICPVHGLLGYSAWVSRPVRLDAAARAAIAKGYEVTREQRSSRRNRQSAIRNPQSALPMTMTAMTTQAETFIIRATDAAGWPIHLKGPRSPREVAAKGYAFTDLPHKAWPFPSRAKAAAKAKIIRQHMGWSDDRTQVIPAP